MLDNGFVIQKDESDLLSLLEWILRVAKKAGLAVFWKRKNEEIFLLIFIKKDEEREKLKEAMEDLASELGEISFRMFSEGNYKERSPHVPERATLLCVDQSGNIIFLE